MIVDVVVFIEKLVRYFHDNVSSLRCIFDRFEPVVIHHSVYRMLDSRASLLSDSSLPSIRG